MNLKKLLLAAATLLTLALPGMANAARTDALWDYIQGGNYTMPNGSPSGTNLLIYGMNHYINFGTVTGVNGYGVRDNGGTIECKNSGGSWAACSGGGGGTGTVTSVDVSGGTTGLTTSGGPVTTSGVITLSGTLLVANGGTGSTTPSGLLKGNGLGAIQTAVANTDYQIPISLTTSGSSGAATFNGTTLNVPQYQAAGTYVTSLTVNSSNGFAGSFSAGATPALTLSTTVTGVVKGNGTALSAAANGTDYTLITGKTCTGSDFFSAVTAAGVFTCTTPAGTTYTATYPITLTGSAFGFAGLSTTSPWTVGQLAYVNSNNTVTSVATGTVSGSAGVSVTANRYAVGGALAVSCDVANGSIPGCLSATDYNTFNGKQAAGNYITALTGDVTATGPGSVAATLASVISAGSCTNCNLTYDAKGRVTVAANGTASANFPFTPFANYNATGTPIGFTAGLFSNSSTTVNGNFFLPTLAAGTLNVAPTTGLSYTTATTSVTNGVGISFTGTPGALIGGTNLTITNSSPLSGLTTSFPLSFSNPALSYIGLGTSSPFLANQFVYTNNAGSLVTAASSSLSLPNTALQNSSVTINTVSSLLTGGGTVALGGTLNINASTSPTVGYLTATTTATSTFLGGINLTGTDCFASQGTCLQTFIQNATAYKAAANYATAAVLAGTPTYSNGTAGVGATLTEVGTGALVIDGQNPSAGQRVLIKNQADQTQNGVYVVTAAGSGIASYVLTRATDFDSPNEVYAGVTVPVLAGGTLNGDTQWTQSTTGTITIGSSNIAFLETSVGTNVVTSLIAGTNISLSGSTGAVTISGIGYPFPSNATSTLINFNGGASTTQLSVTQRAYFGATATTTIDSTGNIVIPSGSGLTITGKSDGCATFATGVLNSTGSACGSGGGGFAYPWTPTSSFGVIASATSTRVLLTQGLNASTTVQFGNAGVAGQFNWDSIKGVLGIGTTTPQYLLQLASSTAPQLALSDGSLASPQFVFRSSGNTLYIATSSPSTFATSSNPGMAITYDGTTFTSPEDDLIIKAYQALGSTIKATAVGVELTRIGSGLALTDGMVRFVAVYISRPQLLTGVAWLQSTQGNYTADNFNGAALYTYSAGTLTQVAITANNGNIWKATANALAKEPFTATYYALPGLYYVGYLYNNSAVVANPATFNGSSGGSLSSLAADFTNSGKLDAGLNTQTVLPSSVAMSALNNPGTAYWFAVY